MLPNHQFSTDLPLGPGQLTSAWSLVAEDLKAALGEPTFELWFSQSTLLKVEENHAVISSPGSMYAIWVEENFREVLKVHLGKYLLGLKGFSLDYSQSDEPAAPTGPLFPEFENREADNAAPTRKSKKNRAPKRPLTAEEILEKGREECRLNESCTFATFVVGANSELAAAAAHAAVETPGTKYQPLFFHSQSGLGKTHLLHAIGWEFLQRRPHARVLYVGAEKFGNDYIDAIRNSKEVAFRNKYRELDLLLIDDVQFLSGKSGFQKEFFHTFNSIIDQKNQIVIASDCLASEIAQLEERLVSRMQWGMTVAVESPDEVTSQAILRKKRDDMKFAVSDETIAQIVKRVSRNVRQLEGALIRTAMVASLNKTEISEGQLDDLLADMAGDHGKSIDLEEIKHAVADYFNVRVPELEGKRRTGKVTEARQVAMYLSREFTTCSLKEVARSFAKDHATVVYAVKTTKEKCEKSETLQNTIDLLRRRISRGNPGRGVIRGTEKEAYRGSLKEDEPEETPLEIENS
jgi:chromosomal replication initiator protein